MTFTPSADRVFATCFGTGHSDQARIGTCDGCGYAVVKTEKGRVINVTYASSTGARRFSCWSDSHECDPVSAAAYAASRAAAIAAGEIVKGAVVTVFKGRKVPIGTSGEVCWIGEDSYGKGRVGIRVEGETVFTATANVKVSA